jgi:NAD(P)H-dependent FMN reductase
MIAVINATNRPQNLTLAVVQACAALLQERGIPHVVAGMDELPERFLVTDGFGNRSAAVEQLIQRVLVPAEKVVVVAPEYNGSFPGIFKAFIDAIEPALWQGKKAALVGVATGRAGNLRGLDHLTDVFHHLGVEVLSAKVPISRVHALLDEKGQLKDAATQAVLAKQLDKLLQF